jgi:hypothetical protein
MANTKLKQTIRDNRTIKNRLKRTKRWKEYKANRGVKTAPTRML